jgi:hypothetical protein
MPHIRDAIEAELLRTGWSVDHSGYIFKKRIENFAPAGSFSDGTREVRLQMDMCGRYLERIDGWGDAEKDVDLRDYAGRPLDAIAAALTAC